MEELGEQIKVENNCEEFINIDEDVAICDTDISAEVVGKYMSSEEEIEKKQEPIKPILTIFSGHNMCRGLATLCGGRREFKWNSN